MKTEFMEYLENLRSYDQQQHSRILHDSKSAVTAALAGNFEKLSRLFFDFPFYYDIAVDGESKVLCVVQQSKRERWIQKYDNLIAQGDFELTYDNGHPHVTANTETAGKVTMFNTDILITACVDLLDPHCNLKSEVIDFFHLHDLIETYQNNPTAMKQIIYHIVYSYWMEIVNVNLGMIAVKSDCNVIQLECLNGFSKALLFSHKEFTPFFEAKIAEYKSKFAEIDFVAYLRDLPVDRISGRMNIEINSIDDSEDINH
jgi:hypothetical protein